MAKKSFPQSPRSPSNQSFRFTKMLTDKSTDTTYDWMPAKLYKGKTGQWFVAYNFRNPDTGKFQRFKVYEDINRFEGERRDQYARDLIRAVNYNLKNGYNPFEIPKDPLEVVVKNWTLYQALNYFKQKLEERQLRKKTLQTYKSTNKLLYEIPDMPIANLTRNMCATFLHRKATELGWENATYNNRLRFAKMIFSFLIDLDMGILEKNPFRGIKPLPEFPHRHKPYDQKLFQQIKDNADPELLRFFLFLYDTGTRLSEACQLEYSHILGDRKDPVLFIPASINKVKRRSDYVPITKEFVERHKGVGRIFLKDKDFYTKRFASLRKKLKFHPDHTLYAVKHTKAIHLVEAGVNPFAIMQFFRHSSVDMTMKYLRSLGLSVGREALI